MKRINSSDRKWLRERITDEIGINVPYSYHEFTPEYVGMKKYSLIKCIMLLHQIDTSTSLVQLGLPQIREFLEIIRRLERAEEDEDYDFEMEVHEELSMFRDEMEKVSMYFLQTVLEEYSGWEIYFAGALDDYRNIPVKILSVCKDAAGLHWGEISEFLEEETSCECLETIGVTPINPCVDFCYSFGAIYIANENLSKVYETIRKKPYCKTWEEYKEIESLRVFLDGRLLFDRVFPNESFHLAEAPCCAGYTLGIVEGAGLIEESSLVFLNYDNVIGLLLADMAASDFLDRLNEEKKEGRILSEAI